MHKTGMIKPPNKIPEIATITPMNKSGFVVGPARPWIGIKIESTISTL